MPPTFIRVNCFVWLLYTKNPSVGEMWGGRNVKQLLPSFATSVTRPFIKILLRRPCADDNHGTRVPICRARLNLPRSLRHSENPSLLRLSLHVIKMAILRALTHALTFGMFRWELFSRRAESRFRFYRKLSKQRPRVTLVSAPGRETCGEGWKTNSRCYGTQGWLR